MTLWEEVSLGEVAELIQGGRHRLSGNHFVSEGGFPAFGAGGHNGYLPSYEFDRPGLVLATTGTCGRVYRVTGKWSSLANTRVIFPDPLQCDVNFLWYQINDPSRWPLSGTSQKFIKPSDVDKHRIRLPALHEQRRIAEVLDRADMLRAKRRDALTQLATLIQSIFLDMFGDPTTNPKGWPRKIISDLATVITGNTPSRAVPAYYGSDIEWIKSDNINTPHYYLTRANEGLSVLGKTVARTVPAGSILVTCIAGSPECIGNAAMTDREVAFNQQINALVPKESDSHFLYVQLLVGKRLVQRASTSGMKGMVSKSRFERIILVCPPLPLQQEFAKRVVIVERLRAIYRASLIELDALFATLQHRSFQGDL